MSGGDDRTRTDDLLIANQPLSQLSYIPTWRFKDANDRNRSYCETCPMQEEIGLRCDIVAVSRRSTRVTTTHWRHLQHRGFAILRRWIVHPPAELFMSEFTIYHNPRCSKSRNTLALLQERGIEPEVVLYLESPPGVDEIRSLLSKLGMSAAQLVRRGEEAYKASGLDAGSTEKALLHAMAANPKLIERPIVVRGERAILGRPPENVLELID